MNNTNHKNRSDDYVKNTDDGSIPLKAEFKQDMIHEILQAINGIRYGSLELVIHDSKVVQIERKEKIRFDK